MSGQGSHAGEPGNQPLRHRQLFGASWSRVDGSTGQGTIITETCAQKEDISDLEVARKVCVASAASPSPHGPGERNNPAVLSPWRPAWLCEWVGTLFQ